MQETLANDVLQEIGIKHSTIPHSFLNLNQLETMIYNERKKAFGHYETIDCATMLYR